MSTPPSLNPQTIGVIVGRDLIGDALIKLPFVRALRNAFPKAEISWITSLASTAYASLLREPTKALIDHIYETPAWVVSEAPVDAPHFDLLIDTRNKWKLARVARKNVPHKVFIAMAMRYLFSDLRPPVFAATPKHMVERLLQMADLAAGYRPSSTGSLPVPEDLLAKARVILPEGQAYIGLAPGAGGAIKIWPRYKFEKVAASQAAKGRVPVFMLGPQELDWFEELSASVPAAKFPLQDYDAWGTAQLSIAHTLAVAKCLDAAVANDSGVGHMLAAVDCRLISLFGPTSPEKLSPRVSHGKIIRAQDFGGTTSMSAIPWETVDAAIDDMVGAKIR